MAIRVCAYDAFARKPLPAGLRTASQHWKYSARKIDFIPLCEHEIGSEAIQDLQPMQALKVWCGYKPSTPLALRVEGVAELHREVFNACALE